MVAVIENWSDVIGRVRHIAVHDAGSDHTTIAVDVERVDDVEGFANLLADTQESTVSIRMRDEQLRRLQLQPGDRIRCRIRRTRGNQLIAHPDSPEIVADERPTN
jgi:transcription termination factor Rho